MLLELRTLADAVLIGSGTLRAEGYDTLVRAPERRARRVAAGQPETPVAVLLSRRSTSRGTRGCSPPPTSRS